MCVKPGNAPPVVIMPPVRVKTAQAPMFCFAKAVLRAEAKSPAPPTTKAPLAASPTASFGW